MQKEIVLLITINYHFFQEERSFLSAIIKKWILFIALFCIINCLMPVGNSGHIEEKEFENVYVKVKGRTDSIQDSDPNTHVMEFEVIGDYESEDSEYEFSNGDSLYFSYDQTQHPEYHDLDEGDCLQIDCALLVYSPPTVTDLYFIDVRTMEETSVPPSLWKYYTPPIVLWTFIAAVIVLVIMIVLVIYLRRRIKNTNAMLDNDDRSKLLNPPEDNGRHR